MALVLADRVKETTTTTGTGTITLAGAATGFQSFAAVGNSNTTYYTIAGQTGSEWEVGIGTYTSSGTTLSRDTVISSSNSGSLVTFSAGTKDVFVTYPAGRSVYANGAVLTASNSAVLPVASGGTNASSAGITAFNNITGYTASGATGTTSTNLVFSTSPTLVTPVLGTPTSGNLSNCTADGTSSVGYLNVPQNAQASAYTLVLADGGKHIYHASGDAAATYTIPAATSVAYPIGTVISFVNLSANNVTIAITTDTMYLVGYGSTGSRTLSQYGVATATKVSGTSSAGIWIISGLGLI
jgi:hypothetical protein